MFTGSRDQHSLSRFCLRVLVTRIQYTSQRSISAINSQPDRVGLRSYRAGSGVRGLNRVSGTHGSSEFNVRPDPPRITARRFIKTVKQKKRFRPGVFAVRVFAAKASGETREGERRGSGSDARGWRASVPDVSDHGAFSWSSSRRSTLD